MKKRNFIALAAAAAVSVCAYAQTPKNVEYSFTEASDLNLVGKILDTPNPYHRVDTCVFKGFTKGENDQVRSSAGLAVLFKTNSTSIAIDADYGYRNYGLTTMPLALRGYDLYIKKDGKWLWAASKVNGVGKENDLMVLIRDMDGQEKECMLYLPMYSELYSVKIGVDKGSSIESLESPFRHRIAIFGSSYTQGISTARSGMSYPMQFMRNTGIQMLSLGCSGNSKLQPYFADVLIAADADAIVIDAFSNPNASMIEERLFPFIERIRAAKPDTPLIFMQTIYRENRNFCVSSDRNEQAKQDMAAKLMAEAVKKYKNVYFIQTNATAPDHEASVDGVHPSDYGYSLWAKSIEKPLLKILRKHGLK
ncbi:MAG: SGNH/GDSL hydrolase family protein [Bacteroidales bacterium]|nr:SGNH/GDSL hydrolase family protein [Bacteroidales bacterium]